MSFVGNCLLHLCCEKMHEYFRVHSEYVESWGAKPSWLCGEQHVGDGCPLLAALAQCNAPPKRKAVSLIEIRSLIVAHQIIVRLHVLKLFSEVVVCCCSLRLAWGSSRENQRLEISEAEIENYQIWAGWERNSNGIQIGSRVYPHKTRITSCNPPFNSLYHFQGT